MSLFQRSTEIRLDVQGMTCGNCVRHVTEALEGVGGVKRVHVDLEGQGAEVKAKEGTSPEVLVAAVEGAGYKATART